MLFNSFEYMIFLPIVFLCYWFVFRSLTLQNLFIVVASLFFYGWWDWRFLLLMVLVTLCSYFSGLIIVRLRQDRMKMQRFVCATNVVLCLGVLAVFKYFNFFGENLTALVRYFGFELDWVTVDILLPIGISFYIFQALSYSIDVYHNKIPACQEIVPFFAFISFFPLLMAGPIERGSTLLPQFQHKRHFDYNQVVDGCRQILWGFFKKVVVADNCALVCNTIWSSYDDQNGFTLLMGAICFSFQIYGDFSGYSDIAIGTARLLGVNAVRNFNFPYFSRDIADFWRRWHMSLTSWFRDYIYIPLGGSRCGKWKTAYNTMVIFLLSGFWHGANWTYVVWGFYHAALFLPLLFLAINRKNVAVSPKTNVLPGLREVGEILLTFSLVMIGWIIFRSDNIEQAYDYIVRMFSTDLFDVSFIFSKRVFVFIFILMLVEWLQRDKQHALQFIERVFCWRSLRWSIYILLILIILLFSGSQTDFIYFQF